MSILSILSTHSDRGFLIRLSRPKEKDREKELRDKERESSREGHSISYSHSALTVSSEAVSLFRFLLKTEEWRSVVEEELMRALQRVTCRVTENKVGIIDSYPPFCHLLGLLYDMLYWLICQHGNILRVDIIAARQTDK